MGKPRPFINISGKADYPWFKASALHLVGSVYYELFKPTETITEDRYQLQLMCLSQALKKKQLLYEQRHNKVILQHDNIRPHFTKWVKKSTVKHLNGKSYPPTHTCHIH